ncbi:hypothetical protein ACOSP7_018014 [Xanthoceras sorbifolium]|uniref:Uncharacterized protein n=1 Tax=Xanthoceras sorbifolium TaxID=99658 RepID=A0ABQ8I0Y1_9ROSI|nr:hypothetical protein JRO89_XS05G0042000 [Xanthoceras sorbifolium]
MLTRLQLPPTSLSSSPLKPSQQLSHLPTTSDSGLLFRQKLFHLQDLNVNPHKALHVNPDFRSTPLSSLLSLESFFLSLGLSRPALGRLLDMHPILLTSDIHADIQPIIDFLLLEVGIPSRDIPKSITRCPRLLVSDVIHQLRPTFDFLRELGFVGNNRINCQTTLLLVSSVERTFKPKIEYLNSLGFSDEEVENMVVRSPGLLTFSVDNNLIPKVEFFREEMKRDLEELKRFPQYFSFSLEKKIKPRHRALVEHGFKLPLSKMLKVSDGEFNARLIEMRLQLLERTT